MRRLIKKSNQQLKWKTLTYEYLDEGFCGLDMPAKNITCWQEGELYLSCLNNVEGANGEKREWHEYNGEKYFGNYTKREWDEFLEDIKTNGIIEKILVTVSKEGEIKIYEGNHRVEAAKQLNLDSIPAEVRYYGNRQQIEKFI